MKVHLIDFGLIVFGFLLGFFIAALCAASGKASRKEEERRAVRNIVKYLRRMDKIHQKMQQKARRCLMKRLFFFLTLFCFLSVGAALAADPTEIDPAVVDVILAGGLLGFGVVAVTQIVKEALKITGALLYLVSLIVSAAAVVAYLIMGGGGFNLMIFIGYTVTVWAVANGWYKFRRGTSS